jgi:hypothetical protein
LLNSLFLITSKQLSTKFGYKLCEEGETLNGFVAAFIPFTLTAVTEKEREPPDVLVGQLDHSHTFAFSDIFSVRTQSLGHSPYCQVHELS